MKYITVGYVVNTHGLKGEVKVKLQTHFPNERFAKKSHLYLEEQGIYKELIVKSSRMHKGMMLVVFDGFEDINIVEAWKGMRLVIKEELLSALNEDEIYYRDLLHMQVKLRDGTLLGEVCELLETGSSLVIRVKGEKQVLIPYLRNFIKKVDVENKTLEVELLDGML